jgi:hypothetical protein
LQEKDKQVTSKVNFIIIIIIITPRACMRSRDKTIGLCVCLSVCPASVVSTKIARSRDLGI